MSKSFQGDIASFPLSDLAQNLVANKKSGTLIIQQEAGERFIQFDDGKIISYNDTQGFSMPQWLVDKGVVEQEAMEDALRRYRRAKRKALGEILNDAGVLALDDYRQYLGDLVKETLYEVFSFAEGTFQFREGDLSEKYCERECRRLRIELAAPSIVMEAARRMDDWAVIRRHMPSENEIYCVLPAERERLIGEAVEAGDEITVEALQLLDGRTTLRKVIARLPYSRFDACNCLAELIAAKKIRPLDGSQMIQRSSGDEDPEQEIACLRTILEREPNNRKILKKLADLLEQQGRKDESATYNKLLAISFLDEGDLRQAEAGFKKALSLNARDIATWQKLWGILLKEGNRERVQEFGRAYAVHFKKLGLLEVARDQFVELVKLFPEELEFKVELADTRFALGDHKAALQSLFDVGKALLKRQRFEQAEATFARILKYDKDNAKAREFHEKLRSGRLAKRRATRRRLLRAGGLVTLFLALCVFLGYELHVRGELFRVTRTVFADSLLEQGEYEEAVRRVKEFQKAHPMSFAAAQEGNLLIKELRSKLEPAPLIGPAEAPGTR